MHSRSGKTATIFSLHIGGERERARVYSHGETVQVFTRRGATEIACVDLLAHAGASAHEAGRLTAPMPGKLLSFAIAVGDKVKRGQPLAVMEAMKMEHTISSPADGSVKELLFAAGNQVVEGAELLKLVGEDA